MKTNKQPYELLVRWGVDGKMAGAHVQYRYVISDDSGNLLADSIAPAEPLALDGFPLSDILSKAQADAIRDNTNLMLENQALRDRLAALQQDAAATMFGHD